ncbi:LacI family DNA-binding transcriptional regulator [Fodinicola acaciae]|uniref:LacI family DNA-binding transcriptional regulator n=1 Tax=Fodinicola acaciae TaxID=2681555 RepID=UPI001C9E1F4B|nr:LacI family DNA-binding transcriptional regulator [Fodinicola acaciae]
MAALAGVSVGTASKAVNGRGQLRPETRARVLTAAAELGFEPNALARGLLSGRSFTVGLITTDSFGRFSIPVMLGAEEALGAGQMSVFLCDSRGDRVREQHYARMLLARRVDGIIVTGRRIEPRPPLETSVPVVYAVGPSADPTDTSVVSDEAGGARLAIEHLIATGRQRIGHITGPETHLAAKVRADAVRQTLSAAGLQLASSAVYFGQWSEEWGRQAAAILLRSQPDVDAVFCGSDQIARGVADHLRENGRRVPDDIALAGFDNWDVMATACRPPLTTVDRHLHDLGRVAAENLLNKIAGEDVAGVRKIPCGLVVRESTR